MLKSIIHYTGNFILSLISPEKRAVIFNHFIYRHLFKKKNVTGKMPERSQALEDVVRWLLYSQSQMKDSGFGSFHLNVGWSSSYPETTGYIICTLLDYAREFYNFEIEKKALQAADWLLSIQKPSGGWQGECVNDNRPEVVFNTGQVMRGLIAAYKVSDQKKYLDASVKAGDWLCSIQHEYGYWKENAFMNAERVYDSYVDVALMLTSHFAEVDKYRNAAIRNLSWIIEHKIEENGWFNDCDNTLKHNDRPIIHTIAYTIDGIWSCGVILGDESIRSVAQKSADKLLAVFEKQGYLNGRFNKNWQGSETIITTGCAQMAVIWAKIFLHTHDEKYRKAVIRMNDFLIRVQQLNNKPTNTRGALPGSFPLWGRYEPFAFPNWAAKYFADSLLYEKTICQIV